MFAGETARFDATASGPPPGPDVEYIWDNGYVKADATPAAEERWTAHVVKMYSTMLMRKAKSWFTGYNSNVDGHDRLRYLMYLLGSPKYRQRLNAVAEHGYKGFSFE